MRKKFLKSIMYSLISMIFLTSCGINKSNITSNKKKVCKPQKILLVKKDNICKTSILKGVFVTKGEVIVVPKIIGTVKELPIKLGSKVNIGDTLAVLDNKEVKIRINQTKTAMDTARIAVEQSKLGLKQSQDAVNVVSSSYEVIKLEYEKMKSKESDGFKESLKNQLDEAGIRVKQCLKSVESAKDFVKQSETTYETSKKLYEQCKKAIEDTVVKAPINGIVSTLNIKKGEVASNAKPIMTIVNVEKIRANIEVPEEIINKIKIGDKLDTFIVPLSNKKVIGTVRAINLAKNSKSKINTIEVEVDNEDSKIKPGMFASVKINIDSKKDVLIIKKEGVTTKNGQNIVYVKKGEEIIDKKVTLGIDNGEYVEVISGLNLGDKVVEK
ncbi:efflux RND transporter periplasmic adaptor subunit [Clostridium botulinum C]|uniref:efflux RND transporter periplasmic adaptor subunit n=1 Tax=Clostridium botulinum TaxID=1491 RepID=UPI001E477CE1|nr:efflux RND transporter periplasmic adaptor subunit [Clostridium botulinum]MCD3245211.1 efflux RND transporter periplasmic adaptor subunit [Clostridium botulinum C]MCD3260718.1 efflux RND transporter periplasmic adaptor subunit [Clostridium botulinum C]